MPRSTRANHPIFRRHPLSGTAVLSTGEAPVPYHIYDGFGLFIGGDCDAAAAGRILQGQDILPLQTTQGRVIVGIWVMNFTDASLGSHHELQFSFFTSTQPVEAIAPNPFNALQLTLGRAGVRMLCHGLWNNTPQVVAYNRELLSLDARPVESSIEKDSGGLRFNFSEPGGGALFSGRVHKPWQASPGANLGFISAIGWRGFLQVARLPWVSLQVLNPLGVALERHAAAQTLTHNDLNVLHTFNPAIDNLDFGAAGWASLGFQPGFYQYMQGIRFIYLHPE